MRLDARACPAADASALLVQKVEIKRVPRAFGMYRAETMRGPAVTGEDVLRALREFFFGMAVYEHRSVAMKEKAALEGLFLLSVFGDVLGLPTPVSIYTLRLFPYACTKLKGWKRNVLRERDWTDWSFD
jgi:hypothetical protein